MANRGNPTGRRYTADEKAKILSEYYAGQSPKSIAEKHGMSTKTLFRWIKSSDTDKDTPSKGSDIDSSQARARDKEGKCPSKDTPSVPPSVTPALHHFDDTANYIEVYASQYDFDKAKLQAAAINGYCQGMEITSEMLDEAMMLEGIDRVYAVLACVKERRQLQDRIIKAFENVSASSDEYERIFGRLFGLKKGDKDEHRGPGAVLGDRMGAHPHAGQAPVLRGPGEVGEDIGLADLPRGIHHDA